MLTGHDDQVVALPEAQQCSSLLNIGDVLFLFHPVGDQIFPHVAKIPCDLFVLHIQRTTKLN